MPLARARCRACALPLGDPPYATIEAQCGRCGQPAQVKVAADGQPQDFDPAFSPIRLLEWLAYARAAMVAGTPGVVLGACSACRAPLAVSSRDPVSLPCPHCGEPVVGTTASVLVDQWTEPWARVTGGLLDVEYRLALLDDAQGISAGCPACAAPTRAKDPSSRCAACGATAWVPRGEGRLQLGVRIDGTREGRPYRALVPIVMGEALLRGDEARGTSARSGSSLLGVTGVGCASALAVSILAALALVMVIYFSHCR
jgi:hypothetical protein